MGGLKVMAKFKLALICNKYLQELNIQANTQVLLIEMK